MLYLSFFSVKKERDVGRNFRNNSQLWVDILNRQARLTKITEQKVKGTMLRSKVRWVEQGNSLSQAISFLAKSDSVALLSSSRITITVNSTIYLFVLVSLKKCVLFISSHSVRQP